MPLTERLPSCKDLFSLCDQYPKPTRLRTEIPPITLPPPWNSIQKHNRGMPLRVRIGRPETKSKTRKRRDTFDREEQRRAKLENDPWSDKTRLTPKSVFCLGCKRNIKLDRRNDYYPGLWLKHRGLCHGIARERARARARKNEVNAPSVTVKSDPPPMDDEQAARILIELMARRRPHCDYSDSESSSC